MILVGRLRSAMPMEFLTDAQVDGYGRFVGVPSRSDLERFFVLDSVDRDLLGDRRGDHNRLRLMVQATTVRYIGVFLKDPVDVPWPVVEYVAEQLGIDDSSCVTRYTTRENDCVRACLGDPKGLRVQGFGG